MQASAPIHVLTHRHPVRRAVPPGPRLPQDPLHGLDRAVRAAIGADFRLLYGMIVPIGLVFGLVIWTFLTQSYWLVGLSVAVECAMIILIVVKTVAMLDEPDADEPAEAPPPRSAPPWGDRHR